MRDGLIVAVGIFLCLVLAPNLPPMVALEKATVANKSVLLVVFIAAFVIGLISMVGLITEMNVRFGQVSTSNADAAQVIADINENSPGTYWRKWKYKFQGESTSSSIQIQVPFRDLKEGFKTGMWTADPVLLRIVLIAIAATTMMLGICGTVFVLANVGIKLVLLVAVAYAVVRTVYAWMAA